ncbi:PREDICTED: proteasome maturation protein [Nicrophorus vespilloides]|uniref:Proteasome maturation protein n=1 Tax=Nicrophorus vespilloides TaxID=110193 RepID=A0ABM1NAH1_NICVS|nr:PREDICTED: proteasome maturation protein [Nicrophorus vespilloides]
MSFALPSLKPKPEHATSMGLQEGAYGVPDLMTCGLSGGAANFRSVHPIMQSEKNYAQRQNTLNMTVLRNTQGLHAPMRLAMELKAAKKIGHLPFLPSHNVMVDSLTGRDLEIGPEDVFSTSEFCEVMGQPHAMVERSLGLL